jgi:hypothetical protein
VVGVVRFYLGCHRVPWLSTVDVPLFISHNLLKNRRTMPVARTRWALDSGGFTELSMHGRWTTSATDYVAACRRYRDEIGLLDWCAPQDAMCEPWILDKARAWLGGTVEAHQRWTVENYLTLREMAPDVPFVPVLQGWQLDDYVSHVDMYRSYGVDLAALPTVGVGSVCRREATSEIASIMATLNGMGLALHGFGVKGSGIRRYGWLLESCDSMAWSYRGRRIKPCPVHDTRSSCANCLHHALDWRTRALDATAQPVQLELVR